MQRFFLKSTAVEAFCIVALTQWSETRGLCCKRMLLFIPASDLDDIISREIVLCSTVGKVVYYFCHL